MSNILLSRLIPYAEEVIGDHHGRVQIFGNNVNKQKFYSGRN
jgi:hypothetical protein